jgi:drug/metabolite transporter (DMT)-like permease
MIFLVLTIISSTLIFAIFKMAGRKGIDNFALISVNYLVASALGLTLGGFPAISDGNSGWIGMAIIIGILFIAIFLVMALTTQKAGMAVSTIASKMSVVIPITFSLIYFNEPISFFKIFSIMVALLAVLLTIYKDNGKVSFSPALILPVILFIGTGTIDSLVKFSQELYIGNDKSIQFSTLLFMISAISGFALIGFMPVSRKALVKPGVLLAGFILGIINFGSLYGLINALESNIFDSSVLFGINNIGIVLLSLMLALLFFREKLLPVNWAGIILSVIAIYMLSVI